MARKAAFKFCGGCNSVYDRKKIYDTLQQLFNSEETSEEVVEEKILIILNGCQRGCISPEEYKADFDKIIDVQEYLANPYRKESQSIIHWIEERLCC